MMLYQLAISGHWLLRLSVSDDRGIVLSGDDVMMWPPVSGQHNYQLLPPPRPQTITFTPLMWAARDDLIVMRWTRGLDLTPGVINRGEETSHRKCRTCPSRPGTTKSKFNLFQSLPARDVKGKLWSMKGVITFVVTFLQVVVSMTRAPEACGQNTNEKPLGLQKISKCVRWNYGLNSDIVKLKRVFLKRSR